MVEHKSSPLYRHLISLKHGSKTDLANGVINNPDAIVLLFHLIPQFGFKTLADFSMDWRKSLTIAQNYFGGNQAGHTGIDFSSGRVSYNTYSTPQVRPGRKPYWYRQGGTPYTNALTADGFKRLQVLLHELSVIGIQV
jgi:hypothetical protein